MLPTETNLDFYAPPPNHRDQAKKRLNHQREDMFSWRSDAKKTSFHPVTGARIREVQGFSTGGPKQIILKDSQRAAEAAEAARKQNESVWASASAVNVVAPDRRREWRMTGFTFSRSHFETTRGGNGGSAKCASADAQARRARNLCGRVESPYVPYFHDSIAFCEPAATAAAATAGNARRQSSGANGAVTAFAVTCNRAEAEQAAHQATHSGGAKGNHLSPALASRQKAVELAENMYEGLVVRQATLTGTAVGSPESLDVGLPTSELAYTLRQSYVEKEAERSRKQWERSQRKSALDSPAATTTNTNNNTTTATVDDSRKAKDVEVHTRNRRESVNSNVTAVMPSGGPISPMNDVNGNGAGDHQTQQQERHKDDHTPLSSRSGGSAAPLADEDGNYDLATLPYRREEAVSEHHDGSRSEESRTTAAGGVGDHHQHHNAHHSEEGDTSDGSPYPPYVTDSGSSAMPGRLPATEAKGTGGEVDYNALNSRESSLQQPEPEDQQQQQQQAQVREGVADGIGGNGGALPAEAKEMRLYAVALKKTVTDQDMTMVQRQEPTRKGVPVLLPDAWRSPMSY